jgi:FkbM family methyltransferase
MKIFYGIIDNNIEVTEICFNKLMLNNIITIIDGDDNRGRLFPDPVFGVVKNIYIYNKNTISEYKDNQLLKIDILNNKIETIDVYEKITNIHTHLQLKYGNFKEELPEQKMAVRYLTGNEKVLEIGGNIGRNSLIISYILGENQCNLVSLETDINIANQLRENRNLNNMHFHIESSALSKRKLIQKGWDTIVSDNLIEGYNPVNIISFDELETKYNIKFDTLVLDCEGAFYYILMDMPEILDNIKLIIMENDYHDYSHKEYIDNTLKEHNFQIDYQEIGGWGHCYNNFFQVWKKV